MSSAGLAAVAAICEFGPMTVFQIRDTTNLRYSILATELRRLEARGDVKRLGLTLSDRRRPVILWGLTEHEMLSPLPRPVPRPVPSGIVQQAIAATPELFKVWSNLCVA